MVALPPPQPISLDPIDWQVTQQDSQRYFSLNPLHFETLQKNFIEIQRWIKEAQYQLEYYQTEVKQLSIPKSSQDALSASSP